MENFAIDLDKVLDEFELDEDANESSSNYDKLQLEFHRENPALRNLGTNNICLDQVGLGAVGGWSEAVHGNSIPVGVRGPPDGHDADNLDSPSCHKSVTPADISVRPRSTRNVSNVIQTNSEKVISINTISTQDESNSLLRESNNSGLLNSSPLSSSQDCLSHHMPIVSSNNLSNQNISKRDNIQFCTLDVVPADIPSHCPINSNFEGQHPDILDMKQAHSGEKSSASSYISNNYENLINKREEDNNSPELPIGNNPLDLPRDNNPMEVLEEGMPLGNEQLLLPDIMANNNNNNNERVENSINYLQEMSDSTDPAVVTENSLNLPLYQNEPAIVQESQSVNRIPELVNVHQSTEQSFQTLEENKMYNESGSIYKLDHIASQNICDNNELIPTVRCLPDVSDVSMNTNEISTNGSEQQQALKFDPTYDVSKDDLYAELQELEEEQERLQGAYGGSIAVKPTDNFEDKTCNSDVNIATSNQGQNLDLIGEIETIDEHTQISNVVSHLRSHSNDYKEVDVENAHEIINNDNSIIDGTSSFVDNSIISDQNLESATSQGLSDLQESSITLQESEVVDDASSESTGTDTASSSSTLTEGESLSADHQLLPSVELEASSNSEIPGSLVTAVYGERENDNTQDTSDNPGRADDQIAASSEYDIASTIGIVAPFWIPDDDAPNCQECGVKFTVIRRRHHCRGCGRVLCAPCCHFKAPLPYMDYKEARVCNTCLQHITQSNSRTEENLTGQQVVRSPNPNNPMEYCSRIPPQQQVGAEGTSHPPTVMVPIGVLKRDNSSTSNSSRGNKQVIFSDGIRPGGDLTELGGQARPTSPYRRIGRSTRRVPPPANMPGHGRRDVNSGGTNGRYGLSKLQPDTCFLPAGGGLPPIIIQSGKYGEYIFDSTPNNAQLEEKMRGEGPPVAFALQKNLTVLVKLVKLDCCVGLEVWNVATRGMCNVGQEELVVLLEVLPGEQSPPTHLFAFFHTVYQQANKGNLVTELGHTIFTEPEGFLGSKDHGGFLYIRPSFQCLHNLVLPPAPYIFAILIQKWETPWAKVFPLRLMLRLGAEFRYYPCPLVSSRNRKPVYCEIGHTIMNLLVDFRNYAYTVPVIQGFVIHMEDKMTTLLIPRNRYEQIWNALNNSNDHVLALGANFSPQSDSHLVTVEDDDGHYTTQAINIHNKPRKVTGASFIVFNGALKSSSGLKAKSSIVEDGLMVQIPGEMMSKLRDSLRHMKDFDIPCGPSSSSEPDERVCVRWIQDDKSFNIGIKSPIDDRPMDGIPSVKIQSGTDYISNNHLIRWTEVFIIQGEAHSSNNDINISRLSEGLARACCVALTPHLELIYGPGPNRLGLRATIHQENVGYEAGIRGSKLLPSCMKELDTELIPVIHRAAASISDEPIVLELIFHIMEQ